MNSFFGEPWDVPATDGARRVDTPLGVSCTGCGVEVADSDRGFLFPHMAADGSFGELPMHRECMLAGTVGHLFGCCSCCGEWPDTPAGRREMALEAWRRLRAGGLGTSGSGQVPVVGE